MIHQIEQTNLMNHQLKIQQKSIHCVEIINGSKLFFFPIIERKTILKYEKLV